MAVHHWAAQLVLGVAALAAVDLAWGQDQRGYPDSPVQQALPEGTSAGPYPPLRLENTSWTYMPEPVPRQFKVHDYVMVRVNEMSRTTSDGEMQGRRNLLYDAILNDWVVLDGLKSVKPSPQSDGDPRIKGQLTQLYRAEGELETSERMSLNIAAEIVDILPNGNLIIEAHERVRNNDEVWEVSLTGSCRPEDIAENNMVLSERIVGLEIYKRELGHVRDTYKRGWFTRWFDQFSPF
jgi:flagellar L-ring protein precursor FlgH